MAKKKIKHTLQNNKDIGQDIFSLLRDQPGDEKSGVNASLGFSFQQWWATLKATELFASREDFAIGMEIKEDVVVLDSADSPTEVEFFQIKKNEREGIWTCSDLLRTTKTKSVIVPSTLAKLYSRRHSLLPHPTKLAFVSNTGFKIALEEGVKTLQHSKGCELKDLASHQRTDVIEKIASQLNINQADVVIDNFTLVTTHLPLGEQEVFVTGKLAELNDQGKLPFTISKPSLTARVLATELQQRASHTDYANTVEKLKDRCLSKNDICQILIEIESSGPTTQVVMDEAISRLDKENFDYGKVRSIKKEKIRICAHLSDRTNLQIFQLLRLINSKFLLNENEILLLPLLGQMMEQLISYMNIENQDEIKGVDFGYLAGLTLLVIENAIKPDVFTSQINPQPQKEQ